MSYNRTSNNAYFFSILTAIIVGVGGAFIGIKGVTFVTAYLEGPGLDVKTLTASAATATTPPFAKKINSGTSAESGTSEESDEDPSFISRFSRVFIYSAKEAEAIFENEPNSGSSSLPTFDSKKITAASYIVTNMNSKDVLLQKDADTQAPIASVSKLVTAVIAKKLLDQNKRITITSQMLAAEGSTGGLRLGEKMTPAELMYPLLMVSSNDAAEALAQGYGRKAFIKEMNNWVNSIGAYRTYFADPSGLSPHNVSTARDISIIADWIEKNEPEIFDTTLIQTKSLRTHTWINPTHFLNLSSYAGGKNGYIPEAKLTNVSLFSVGSPKKLYSVVLLGSKVRDADTLDALHQALE